MKLINTTRNICISSNVKLAKSFSDRLFGLLRKSNPRTLIFYTRFGIHTIGMKYPIDVAVLNKEGLVMKLVKSLKPNRFFFYHPKNNIVIEMPNNTIKNSHTSLNDKIMVE